MRYSCAVGLVHGAFQQVGHACIPQ